LGEENAASVITTRGNGGGGSFLPHSGKVNLRSMSQPRALIRGKGLARVDEILDPIHGGGKAAIKTRVTYREGN